MALFVSNSRAGLETLCQILSDLEACRKRFNPKKSPRKPPGTAPALKPAPVIDIGVARKKKVR